MIKPKKQDSVKIISGNVTGNVSIPTKLDFKVFFRKSQQESNEEIKLRCFQQISCAIFVHHAQKSKDIFNRCSLSQHGDGADMFGHGAVLHHREQNTDTLPADLLTGLHHGGKRGRDIL